VRYGPSQDIQRTENRQYDHLMTDFDTNAEGNDGQPDGNLERSGDHRHFRSDS